MPVSTYDPNTPAGQVRLLLNDVDMTAAVFDDSEIAAFLALEGGNVKLAAAQAIDTNADNEALASKVLTTQDLSTDGSKIADALRQRAAALRQQVVDGDADGFFDVVEMEAVWPPELSGF